ncbi:Uncharacterised protein [uncultured Flavonifractor sp.]|nr:Uncharacterised protein [uncultured Flavonifractor sp.]
MASREELNIRLKFHRAAAEKLRAAYIALVDGGVQSYSIGSRSLTRLDISKIMEEIRQHEKEADALEEVIRGGKRRKAVGVVPRDW